MFDVSFWEVCLVAIIALVVMGPEKIPQVARTVVRWTRLAKNTLSALFSELDQQMQAELTEEKPLIEETTKTTDDDTEQRSQ